MTYPGSDYQGLGFFQPPPEPPRRRLLPIILAAVAIVLVAGAVVTVVLLNRQAGGTAAPPSTSANRPTSTTTTTTTAPRPTGGQSVPNPDSKITYDVPKEWTVRAATDTYTLQSLPGVTLTHLTSLSPYTCENKNYSRGIVGTGTVERAEINQRATDLAKAFGTEFYAGTNTAEVVVGTPKRITRTGDNGEEAVGVEITATVTTAGDGCLAGQGEVVVVLLDYQDQFRLLVVNGDLKGGPDTPPSPGADDLESIATSGRPVG
ncbi:hypothetical protein [Actinokineospora enzanensis]|uniref:hypothetical protein n=1 Tax=Actinokineospora enzanensis TaxID=155975 RepID=UPI0003999588|nr:hypothetical protein [Actinokineospora enzanensis]